MVAVLDRPTIRTDARQELRDVASAIRQVAALMPTMTDDQRVATALDLYQCLKIRLDSMTG